MSPLSNRHQSTLEAIFDRPTRANIAWRDIVSLFYALNAYVDEGRDGSRVAVDLNDRIGHFHAPHQKEAPKSIVTSVRRFLESAGVDPEGGM